MVSFQFFQLFLFFGSTAHVPKYSLSRHGRWVKITNVIIKLKSDFHGMYDLKWVPSMKIDILLVTLRFNYPL